MSEKIEFIPANELPEAEGDEVSVLCVENGELKQKAASGLGGGGADLVVVIDNVAAAATVIAGSYDGVEKKFLDGRLPVIWTYIAYKDEYDGEAVYNARPTEVNSYCLHEYTNEAENFIEVYCDGSSILLRIDSTGVIEYNCIG